MKIPLRYSWRSLMVRRTTTALTVTGIAVTVVVFVASLSLVNGLRRAFSATGDSRQLILLRKGSTSEAASSVTPESFARVRELPGIAQDASGTLLASLEVVKVISLPSSESRRGSNVSVRGLSNIGRSMRPVALTQGRWFAPGQREVVVGKSIAARFPDANVGHTLHFGRGSWQVVGVMDAGESEVNSEIWSDINQLSADYNQQASLSSILVRTADPSNLSKVAAAIDADRLVGLTAIPEKEYYEKQTSAGAMLEFAGIFVAIIMAIGSSFAAMNTMYAAVHRRGREIGTLKTLGFSRFQILTAFVMESLLLGLAAGILGGAASFPLNFVSTAIGNFATFSEIEFQFHVGITTFIAGLIFSLVLGSAGGLLPARAGARKEILAALREE